MRHPFITQLRENVQNTFRDLLPAVRAYQENGGAAPPAWQPPTQAPQPKAPPAAHDAYRQLAMARGNLSPMPLADPRARVGYDDQGELTFTPRGGRDEPESEPEPEAPRPTDWGARDARLRTTYELSDEEFRALNPEQQNAVLFNTGLMSAAQADVEAGNSQATRDYLSQLGIKTRSDAELNEFLQLDRAIGQSILDKLGKGEQIPFEFTNLQQTADRPRNMVSLPPKDPQLANALTDSQAAASALADQLRSSGLFFGQQAEDRAQPGFGTSMNDEIVRKMYAAMIDDRYELTTDDVVAGLAEMNQAAGTSVTPEEVWSFLNSQLSASGFGGGDVLIPWDNDPVTGEAVKALKPDEIRRRYGL